ncbi:hypothetical protein [Glycomyces rhizosphaerae]|uniref:Uncharacterized protein n=1 Tax=Glycomyces rhizosphaerae TaxID=2054422 RepID=A0ABV7PX19_9ACTN
MSSPNSRRRNRTVIAAAVAVAAGAAGIGLSSRTVSVANSWDSGVSVPSFKSTDAKRPTAARSSGGKLPAVSFLTTVRPRSAQR